MKFLSWNVNGIRACLGKGFIESVLAENPDFICIQETKMQLGQATVELDGYEQFWCSAGEKGLFGNSNICKV